MFSELDPFLDFRCPHCSGSLRFRRVKKSTILGLDSAYACPLCSATLSERQHPAIANNWLWSRFYLPGVLLVALGVFVPALGWLLPWALAVLLLGFVALIVYIVRARWGWKRYVPYVEKE